MSSNTIPRNWAIAGHALDLFDHNEAHQLVEYVEVFPGWATRKPTRDCQTSEIELCVSGYAALHYPSPAALGKRKSLVFDGIKKFADVCQKQVPLESPRLAQTTTVSVDSLHTEYTNATTVNNDSQPDYRTAQQESGEHDDYDEFAQELPELLKNRLLPFLARPLPNRNIEVSVGPPKKPLVSMIVKTTKNGSFEARVVIKPEVLEKFSELDRGQNGLGQRLIPVTVAIQPCAQPRGATHRRAEEFPAIIRQPSYRSSTCTVGNVSSIRVISDIDDTIRDTRAYAGKRAMFRSMFMMEHKDVVIKDMSKWYQDLARKGACFHYVSTKPYSLAASIREFIKEAKLPEGSIHLKSFYGSEFFDACVTNLKKRKVQSVSKLIKQFPESNFILIGNSSLRGLEAYAELAKTYEGRILGIFIRDVHQGAPLKYPTGESPSGMTTKEQVVDNTSPFTAPIDTHPAAEPEQTINPQLERRPSSLTLTAPAKPTEKKRKELQDRVTKARKVIPPGVKLRVFMHPTECDGDLPQDLTNSATPTSGRQLQRQCRRHPSTQYLDPRYFLASMHRFEFWTEMKL